jgi:hypothetical protein
MHTKFVSIQVDTKVGFNHLIFSKFQTNTKFILRNYDENFADSIFPKIIVTADIIECSNETLL